MTANEEEEEAAEEKTEEDTRSGNDEPRNDNITLWADTQSFKYRSFNTVYPVYAGVVYRTNET